MKENNLGVYFITISIDEAGQRIDNFLRTYLKGVPKSMIYRIIRKGEIQVNKKRVKIAYRLQGGDIIRIPPVRQSKQKQLLTSIGLGRISTLTNTILYEDNDLLILNKPSGTAVHGGSGISFGIIEGLRALRPEIHFLELVHRLDRETSGVLLIAKQRSALRSLHEQLRIKEMKKDYLMLVQGQWQSHIKVILAPLLKNTVNGSGRIVRVNSKGKPSETHFKVEERFAIASLVKASPVTGRTHQIRVHAQYAGHFIAYDNCYGENKFNQQLKGSGLNRLFLHATTLCFKHPRTGIMMRIEAPLDKVLRNCLHYLRSNHHLLV